MLKTEAELQQQKKPRWFYAYIVLALFDLITVLISLYLNDQIISIYQVTAEQNKQWAGYQENITHLSELALITNTPGNDVFETKDLEAEQAKYAEAKQALIQHMETTLENLKSPDVINQTVMIRSLIQDAGQSLERLNTEVMSIFQEYGNGNLDVAASHMSFMDRRYAELASQLANAAKETQQIQLNYFDSQNQLAQQLKLFEWVIGGCIIVMVIGAGFYGNALTKSIQREDKKKKQTEFHLNSLFNSTLDCIIVCDEQGVIQKANKAVTDTLGYETHEMIGNNISVLIPSPISEAQHNKYISDYLKGKISKIVGTTREMSVLRKDGSIIPITLGVNEMKFADKSLFVSNIHDISQLKAAESKLIDYAHDLEDAKQKAEEANRLKSDFLARMSHEIRTPMNGIIGMAQMLGESELNDDQEKQLQVIQLSSRSLLHIINDILDLSKIESNKLELEKIPFNIFTIVNEVYELFENQAKSKGIDLVANFQQLETLVLVGDPVRFKQILLNLVNNAVKFTETGSVRIEASAKRTNELDKHPTYALEFNISDTGPGITPEAQTLLFQPFQQADTSTTRKTGGTGLGLAICKQLAELMRGTVKLESEEGIGSTFTLSIRLPAADTDEQSHLVPSYQSSEEDIQLTGKVLVADDVDINRMVIQSLLETVGLSASVVCNGIEAIELWKNEDFDLILMDCEMPEMDGYTATQEIRAQETDSRIPIIALTANAYQENKQKCLDAGMDDFLTKPIDKGRMVKVLKNILNTQTTC